MNLWISPVIWSPVNKPIWNSYEESKEPELQVIQVLGNQSFDKVI